MNNPGIDIQKIANISARYAVNRLSAELSQMDLEDVRQAACEGIVKALNKKSNECPEYYYKSARNEAIKYIIQRLWGKNPIYSVMPLDIFEDEISDEDLINLPSIDDYHSAFNPVEKEYLINLRLSSRRKKCERG